MASLIKKGNGRWSLQFRLRPDVDRVTITLGDVTELRAKDIQDRVEKLVVSIRRESGRLMSRRAIGSTSSTTPCTRSLAEAGLVVSRVAPSEAAPAVPLLGKFIDELVRKRTDLKETTKTAWGHTKRCLIDFFFGETRPLDRITAGEAEDFRRWLVDNQKVADNTVRCRMGFAKQFFHAAVRYEYLRKSPFAEIGGCLVRENRDVRLLRHSRGSHQGPGRLPKHRMAVDLRLESLRWYPHPVREHGAPMGRTWTSPAAGW